MKKFTLFVSDLLLLYGAFVLMLLSRYGNEFHEQYQFHLLPFSIIFALWLVVFYIADLYKITQLRNNPLFYGRLLKVIFIASVISIIFFYLIPLYGITPKTNLLIFILFFTGLEIFVRSLFNNLLERRFKKPMLIVGLNQQSLELAKFIKDNPQLGYGLKYVIDVTPGPVSRTEEEFEKFGIKEGVHNIKELIRDEKINTIVISPEAYQRSEVIEAFYEALEYKITVWNLASFYEQVTERVPLGAINQTWFLDNLRSGSLYEISKRVFDIFGSILIGIITLPLYPFIFLILGFDEGKGFWSIQKRVGRDGKPIQVYKFRTMLIANDQGQWNKVENRVTRIGAFLRKTRLDEIPQLWNVLLGSLSLIGPRPEFPSAVENYRSLIPYYDIRHLVKPGLSGWAQTHHEQHPHHHVDIAETQNKLSYDLYYIKNRSLALDLEIILKTINTILRQGGK